MRSLRPVESRRTRKARLRPAGLCRRYERLQLVLTIILPSRSPDVSAMRLRLLRPTGTPGAPAVALFRQRRACRSGGALADATAPLLPPPLAGEGIPPGVAAMALFRRRRASWFGGEAIAGSSINTGAPCVQAASNAATAAL